MGKFRKCYLHIGTEKTGSTSLQRYLEANRQSLSELGHYYPSSLGPRRGSHYYVVVNSRHDTVFDDLRLISGVSNADELVRFKKKLRLAMTAEFETCRNQQALHVSTENAHSRLVSQDSIERTKELLAPWVDEFKIIAYLRPQHEVAVSLYSTHIKLGGELTNPFPGVNEDSHYYNYYMFLEKWSAVFGRENVIVRPFSRDHLVGGDLISDYQALVGVELNTNNGRERENASLSPEGLQFLGMLNEHLPRFDGVRPAGVRKNIAEVVEQVFPGKGPGVCKSDAEEFYRRFESSNELLFRNYFDGEDIFKPDFSKYSAFDETVNLTPEVLVEMFSKVWKAGDFCFGK